MAKGETSMNLDENVACMVCYILTWVTGIIFFLMEKKNKTVRFHAMQSILTFLPLTILGMILGWVGAPRWTGTYPYGFSPGIPALIWVSWAIYAIMAILWLILVIKSYQGEKFKVPIIGDIAENQVK